MPAPTLTPAEALDDYALTVSQIDLDDAANVIHAVTASTLAEHVDVRNVSAGNVRRAWAIVASRIRADTEGDDTRTVTSESERDYSYSESADMKAAAQLSLLAGRPNELLAISAHWGSFSREGQARADRAWSGRNGVPVYIDDFGVPHPT